MAPKRGSLVPITQAPEEFRPRGFWCENSSGAMRPTESVKDTQLPDTSFLG